jgi:hypothetical protein
VVVGLAVVEDRRGIKVILRRANFTSSKQREYFLPARFVALVDFLVGAFGVGEPVPIAGVDVGLLLLQQVELFAPGI